MAFGIRALPFVIVAGLLAPVFGPTEPYMLQNGRDDLVILDPGDDPDRPAALLAAFNVDAEAGYMVEEEHKLT